MPHYTFQRIALEVAKGQYGRTFESIESAAKNASMDMLSFGAQAVILEALERFAEAVLSSYKGPGYWKTSTIDEEEYLSQAFEETYHMPNLRLGQVLYRACERGGGSFGVEESFVCHVNSNGVAFYIDNCTILAFTCEDDWGTKAQAVSEARDLMTKDKKRIEASIASLDREVKSK